MRAVTRTSELRQAKVKNLHAAIFGDKDILGFQIAVNDSFLMRRRQAMRDLQRVVNRFPLRQGDPAHALAKSFTFQQFRDDVRRIVVRIDVINNEDIRMIQRAGGLSFLLKSREPLFVSS